MNQVYLENGTDRKNLERDGVLTVWRLKNLLLEPRWPSPKKNKLSKSTKSKSTNLKHGLQKQYPTRPSKMTNAVNAKIQVTT